MNRLRRHQGVDEDIIELATYFLEHSPSAARRFVDSVEETLKEIADQPGIGQPKAL